MTEAHSDFPQQGTNLVRRRLDAIVTSAGFLLSAVGIAANRVTPDISYRYWVAMIAVMAVAGMIVGGSRVRHHPGRVFLVQILHWLAVASIAVMAHLVLRSAEIGNENMALMIMLILALGTFIDGVRMSWRLAVLGIMLAVSVWVSLYYPPKVWLMPLVTVAALILTLLLDRRHRSRPTESEPLPEQTAPTEAEAEMKTPESTPAKTETAQAEAAKPA